MFQFEISVPIVRTIMSFTKSPYHNPATLVGNWFEERQALNRNCEPQSSVTKEQFPAFDREDYIKGRWTIEYILPSPK